MQVITTTRDLPQVEKPVRHYLKSVTNTLEVEINLREHILNVWIKFGNCRLGCRVGDVWYKEQFSSPALWHTFLFPYSTLYSDVTNAYGPLNIHERPVPQFCTKLHHTSVLGSVGKRAAQLCIEWFWASSNMLLQTVFQRASSNRLHVVT